MICFQPPTQRILPSVGNGTFYMDTLFKFRELIWYFFPNFFEIFILRIIHTRSFFVYQKSNNFIRSEL